MRYYTVIFSFSLLLIGCGHLFYYPDSYLYSKPEELNFNYENHIFASDDAYLLHAWWFPVKNPKGTIIFFHGNAQNLTAHFFQIAWIIREGYQVFIGDYRGYGLSKGKPDRNGVFKDSLAMLSKGYELHKKTNSPRLIIYGQSLGGAAAIPALAESPIKNKVDLLIIEAAFHSYQGIAFQKLNEFWLTIIFSPLAYLVIHDRYAPDKFLPKLKTTPLLLIHSKADRIVPIEQGRKIFENYEGPKEFWEYDSYDHMYYFSHKKNQKRLLNYLNMYPYPIEK